MCRCLRIRMAQASPGAPGNGNARLSGGRSGQRRSAAAAAVVAAAAAVAAPEAVAVAAEEDQDQNENPAAVIVVIHGETSYEDLGNCPETAVRRPQFHSMRHVVKSYSLAEETSERAVR